MAGRKRLAGKVTAPADRSHTYGRCRESSCAETGRAGSSAPARLRAGPTSGRSSRRAAAKCRSRKRSRNSASKASSLRNHASAPASRQKLTTSARVGSSSAIPSPPLGPALPSMPAVSSFIAWPGRRGGVSGVGIGSGILPFIKPRPAWMSPAICSSSRSASRRRTSSMTSATSSWSTPSFSERRAAEEPAPIRTSRGSGSRRRR